MRPFVKNTVNGGGGSRLMVVMFAMNIACCGVAQETAGWGGAKVTTTDLLKGDPKHGKFAYSQAAVATRAGCHVAKVEGERGKEVFVRRDGQRGKAYEDIAPPVFSPDGSALAYAVRGVGGSRFIINEREGPLFEEVIPETFVFSNDGKRHAYLARKAGRLVAVVDGVLQTEAGGDMVPRLQPPVFSADGSSVGYLEGSRLRKKMRVVVNGKPGEIFDGVDLQSLRFSPDGRRLSYGANDRTTRSSWFCVIDGQQRSPFDDVGISYAFSPDGKRFAYRANRAGQRYLVVDGESEIPVEGIGNHTITFSPDSRRLAYAVVKPDRRGYLVLDGKAGPVNDGIVAPLPPGLAPNRPSTQAPSVLGYMPLLPTSVIVFSPDSRRLAYAARSGQTFRVYLYGEAEEVEMDFLVGGMEFSGDSKRLAYGGRRGNKIFLVVDGKKGADYDALGDSVFSHDGKHMAFAAKKGDQWAIVVDGQERAKYDAVPAGPVFRSDGVLELLATDQTSLYRIEVRGF